MSKFFDLIKVTPQYLIPKHMLSSAMHWFMQVETRWVKNITIKALTKIYGINVSEAADEDIENYPHFNAFFTRALKPEARPIDDTPNSWVSPVDGLISQATAINGNKIIQAKCHDYTVEALVGGDIEYAKQFTDGDAMVIYLSPKDYHRIHIPVDAKLLSMTYVPGDLFAVNPATVRQVEGLFARNERLVIRFENQQGPFCLVMVGAIFVGSMETVWQGKITPEYQPTIQHWDYRGQNLEYKKGDEIGRFNMGSTVVLLTPNGQLPELGKITVNTPIQMGQHLAKYPELDRQEHQLTNS
ncbi:archaetidylserine decarboxylase [Thiomicrorhabdus sediminis]|uniref:Phosphatidylserine decarboxylase proenzyme n=1 Tax=Thiomicrorhabdus sediminis TaxID=2580412 RepID=A0A4P9K7D8_9GAMM|nr:archaetidylserine decarboxylase [Thiomicrorhabdus sediminis]QCU90380.1 phosphatidylserine decarboxylase [Thiomicrorhabdus sediminis]